MSHRLRSLLEPSSIVAFALVGALAATGGAMALSLFIDPIGPLELQVIPDRFTDVLLEKDWEEGAHATLPTIGASAPMDSSVGVRGLTARDDTTQRGKLLSALIGTRGEAATEGTVEDLLSDAAPVVAEAATPALRAWFPDTLIWSPRVRTDQDGRATVELSVPDQLTTWRVLGLSAAADGSTSGDVLHFDSALDHFVEPLAPARLRAGDRLELPVRVGNRTTRPLAARLSVSAEGLSGGGSAAMRVAPGAAATTTVSLRAELPGQALVTAALGGADRVARPVEVLPVGQHRSQTHTGLLAGSEQVPVELPEGVSHARATLVLVPGPVGLLRSELAAGARGDDIPDHAAAFRLGAAGPGLLAAAGVDATGPERDAFRALRLRSQQGLLDVRTVRGPVHRALALRALEASTGDPVTSPIADHLRQELLRTQAPDGTWAVPDGATLQRLLATTAWVATVLDEPAASTRAAAVFERYAPQLLEPEAPDPYTPALVLASQAVDPVLAERLRARVRVDLPLVQADPTLLARLVRPDGAQLHPSDLALALAAAGEGGQLAAQALSAWTPQRGFGDGFRTQAVLDLLESVELERDALVTVQVGQGEHVQTLTLLPGQPAAERTVVLPLSTSGPLALHSDGPAALAWRLSIETWTPWQRRPHPTGLAVRLSHDTVQVGQPAELRLEVDAPGDAALTAELELPVGVQVDEGSLEGAQWELVEEGRVRLSRAANHKAQTAVSFTVLPTLAGELWSGATRVWLDEEEEHAAVAAPELWLIAGR